METALLHNPRNAEAAQHNNFYLVKLLEEFATRLQAPFSSTRETCTLIFTVSYLKDHLAPRCCTSGSDVQTHRQCRTISKSVLLPRYYLHQHVTLNT